MVDAARLLLPDRATCRPTSRTTTWSASATGSVYAELRDGAVVGGSLTAIGVSEGSAQWVAVVQAPKDAAKVRATFPGGATDEMEPVDGVAVLVGAADIAPDDSGVLQRDRATRGVRRIGCVRSEPGTASFGGYSMGAYAINVEPGANDCVAPQELPAPGPEQPADVAAARQAVTDAFLARARRARRVAGTEMAAIDDPTELPRRTGTTSRPARSRTR